MAGYDFLHLWYSNKQEKIGGSTLYETKDGQQLLVSMVSKTKDSLLPTSVFFDTTKYLGYHECKFVRHVKKAKLEPNELYYSLPRGGTVVF